MDSLSEKVFEFLYNIPKSYYLPIVLAGAGLICLCIGLMQLSNSHNQPNSQPTAAEESPKASSSAITFGIQVDVEGAVVHPGVYKLPQNARVQDALIAGGGLSGAADREVVAKSLNLAAKLTDGVKIYVPKVGETQVLGSSTMEINPSATSGQAGLININSASLDQLDSLPGIGPVTAQKIINARPFSSVDDMLAKKAVTNSVFQKIKDKITVY